MSSSRWETRWDHRERERALLELWDREGLYKERGGSKYIVIDTPPPYTSGRWHVGGAAHFAQIDMVARYFRLKGYSVVVPFYADRNGLPVEVQVEKAHKISAKEMARTPEGRVEFLRLCKEFLDRAEREIVAIWRRLGCSFEYWPEGTDSEMYRAMTQETFVELYQRGLIYEAERPVRWCPRCGTTLAEAEVEHEEEEGKLYYVNFKLDDGRPLTVATTRPELLAGCAALAYNPKDARYAGLAGRVARAPIYEHELIIVEHPSVDPSFGTGLMMICSYGDEHDVRLFSELGLRARVVIKEDGRMSEDAGPLAGLTVAQAREAAERLLAERGELVKVERIVHKVPRCWRCKTPLQIIHRKELFLSQLAFREELRKIIDRIDFKPEMHKKKLIDWLESVSMDWPISRDRYYATEIPLWRCRSCGAVLLPPERGKYYKPWQETPWERCPRCGAPAEQIEGEKRVFDTWFDSSITPLYVTRRAGFSEYPEGTVIRPQGQDIIRTWLYYTILRIYQLTGKPAFVAARITGMGLDPTGRPMHKSLGNVIDPEPIVDEYGADAFRFWAAIASKLGYDYRFDENKIKTGKLFVTKLWNVARFLSSFPQEGEITELTDRAFLALYEKIIEEVDRAYAELDVYEPGERLYELAWDIIASNYLELIKDRIYNRSGDHSRAAQTSAAAALHKMFRGVLIALSPIMPFITDDIFRRLYGESVHRQRFPEPSLGAERDRLAEIANRILELNSAIWTLKRKRGLKLSDPLPGVLYLPKELEGASKDIATLHRAEIKIYETPPQGAEEIAPGIYMWSK